MNIPSVCRSAQPGVQPAGFSLIPLLTNAARLADGVHHLLAVNKSRKPGMMGKERMFSFMLTVVALLAANAVEAQTTSRPVLHGHHVAPDVARLSAASRLEATQSLDLTIGLPLRNRAALDTFLQELADPASPQYRHFLTPQQFTERFGPTKEDYAAVVAYAQANGFIVDAPDPGRVLVSVHAPVAVVEKAFHVQMQSYQHPREARQFYAPDVEPTLDLAVPVQDVGGLDNFVVPHPAGLVSKPIPQGGAVIPYTYSGSGAGGTYAGNDFRAAYAPGVTLTGTGQSAGLVEFGGYEISDIVAYENTFESGNQIPIVNVLLNGVQNITANPGGEEALDLEMQIAMAPGLTSIYYYDGTTLDTVLSRIARDNVAKQISSSWGAGTDGSTDGLYQQLAAQGITYFNAAGDSDAYPVGSSPPPCLSTPYVTCVGGTWLNTTGPDGAWSSEIVWNWGTNSSGNGASGTCGGISPVYAIPSWQTNVNMTANHGSTTMRNFPDVAMTAANIDVYYNGGWASFSGTSCAAPLWAGFMALVNQQAASYGQPPAGALNPAIYAVGKSAAYTNAFHDITSGNNCWPSSPTNFPAVTGYDLCTGWGTPQGQATINAIAPPGLQITPSPGVVSAGRPGGPFSVNAQIFVLTNASTQLACNWSLTSTSSWLTVSATNGTLAANASTTVTVSLKSSVVNSLAAGSYSATLVFTNPTLADSLARTFGLVIGSGSAVWSGGASPNGNWSAGTNWLGNVAPTNGANLLFANGPLPVNTNNLLTSAGWVQLDTGTANDFYGNALSLASGMTNFAGNNTWNIPLTLAANQNVDVASNATLTVGGAVTGGNGLTKTSAGILWLTASNTYTGGTTVNGGTLQIGGANDGNSRAGSGLLTVNTGATVTVVAENPLGWDSGTTTPSVVINGGTFNGGGYDFSAYNWTLTNGTLTGFGAPGTGLYFNRTPAITSAGTSTISVPLVSNQGFTPAITVSSGVLTISSPITGTGGLASSGGGMLVLAVNTNTSNTYSGGTVISGGTLSLGSSGNENVNALGTGLVTVSNNASLQFSPGGSTSTFAVTNAITLNNGTLLVWDGHQHMTGPVAVGAGGGTLSQYYDTKSLWLDGVLSGSGPLMVNNPNSGSYQPYAGVHFSNPTNTYSGTITVSGNSVTVDNANALANAIVNVTGGGSSGALQWGSGVTGIVLGGLSGTYGITNGGNALTVGNNNASTIYSGVLSGAGTLTKVGTGTFVLSANNTYTGATMVSNGVLQVDGVIGAGAVTASGGTLAGAGTVNGATTVPSGGTLAPGDGNIGTLTVGNSVTLNAGAVTVTGVSKNGGVASNGKVVVTGALAYGGTLTVTNVGTNAFTAGDSFQLFNAASHSGGFSTVTLPALAAGLLWNTNSLLSGGTIAVGYVQEPLTYTAGANGTISGSSPQTVNYGANGTAVTAVANANYRFFNWSDGSTANPRTDTDVTNFISVTANFAVNTFTLTYTAGANGTISGTTPQTVNYGASGTAMTAVPNSGFGFTNWSDGSLADPRTDTNVTNNLSVTANFVSTTNGPLVWNGGGGAGNWSVAGNWGWAVPANGQALTFQGVQQLSNTNDFLTAVGQVVFNASGFTLAGSPVALQGGLWNGTGTNVWGINVTLGSAQGFVSSNGILTVSGAVTNAGYPLTLSGPGGSAVSGVVSGSGGLVKNGTGMAALSAANTCAGPTTVDGGTLALASGNVQFGTLGMSSSLTVNSGGTVQINADNSLAGWGSAVGALPVTINAGGTLTGLGTADSGAGPSTHIWGVLTLNGGTLNAGGSQNQTYYGTWDLNDGVAVNGGTNTSSIVCQNVIPCQTGGTIFNVAAGGTASGIDLLVSGTLIGGGGLADTGIIKTGSGTMALAGANTYAGSTTVSGGILQVDGAIGAGTVTVSGGTLAGAGTVSGATTVQSGGTLAAGDGHIGTLTVSNSLTLNAGAVTVLGVSKNGGVASNGEVVVTGTLAYGGMLTVTNVGTNAFTAGDSFQLFNAASYSGGFGTVMLPALAAGLIWNTNSLLSGGTIAVGYVQETLTYTAGANGTISGTSPQSVNYGANGTAVTAVPNTGYHFVNWSDGAAANPRTDTDVTNNVTVTAIFAINTYTLTYPAGTNGAISGTSPQTVNYGANGSAVIPVPNTGYHFVNWSDGLMANPRTDTDVTNNVTVTANFAVNTYTLTYLAGTNGTISGTTPQTVNYGANGMAVTALPATGYSFTNWSDGSLANPRTDLNVTSNLTVTANFAASLVETQATADALGYSSLTGTANWTPATGIAPTNALATAYNYVTGTTLRTPANQNAYTILAGSLTINGGELGFKGSNVITIPNLILNGGIIQNSGTGGNPDMARLAGTINLKASSTIHPSINVLSVITNAPGVYATLTMSTSGTLLLSAQNTFNGSVTVDNLGGTNAVLQLGTNNALPSTATVTLAGGAGFSPVLDLNGYSTTISNLTFTAGTTTGYVTNTAAGTTGTLTLGYGNATETISYGAIADKPATAGTVALTKIGTGTLTLAGTNTYSGGTTVSGGVLLVSGSLGTGAVTVANTATVTGGGLINGPTTIQSGGQLMAGNGGVGCLTVNNSLGLNAGAQALLRINDNGGVSTNDQVAVTGSLTLGGTLTVTNIGTNALTAGNSFQLFNAASYTGGFVAVNLPGLAAGLVWNTNNLAVNGTIFVASVPETLTYLAGANGSISGTTPQTVNYGANGTSVTAVANAGYSFAGWSDGSTANPRTDANVTNTISVTANFTSDYETLVLAQGPNTYWRLDETNGSTTFADASGNGHTATAQGTGLVIGVAGPQPPPYPLFEATNTCAQFNGANNFISGGTGASLNGTNDFTVSAWVQTTATTAGVIVQQRDPSASGYIGEYQLAMNSGGAVSFYIYGNGGYQFQLATPQAVNDGQWHTVMAERSGGTNGYIYIDGVLAASATGAIESLSSAITNYVGQDVRNGNNTFSGQIDEVAIFTRALTANQIAQLSNTNQYLLPAQWTSNAVGTVATETTATYFSKAFTVGGAGAGLATNSDSFSFVSLPLTNGVTITAEVAGLQTNGTAPLAGVMVRSSTNAGAVFAFMGMTPANSAEWVCRTATNAISSSTTFTNLPLPYWVRLIWSTNTFTGYVSSNGMSWVQSASVTLTNLAANALVGLVASSGLSNVLDEAVYDNVTVTNGGVLYYQPLIVAKPAPPAYASLESFAIGYGTASFTITGDEGSVWRIEDSDDLMKWTTVETVTLIGGSVSQTQCDDARPARYFRLVQVR